MQKSLVLITIINYNGWKDTIECIDSIERSNFQNYQILIIDNKSSDDSAGRLKKNLNNKHKLIQLDKNIGFAAANNLGIKTAISMNCKYIVLLNNDTIVEKRSLTELINQMNLNTEYSLGTGCIYYYPNKYRIWYDGGKLIRWRASAKHFNYKRRKKNDYLYNKCYQVNFISGCYMCIRLRDLDKLGYLNENFFMYLEDIEYSLRALKNHLKLLYVPFSIIYHKANGEGIRTPQLIYYSLRNRKLLIKLHLGIVAKIYFYFIINLKRFFWFFMNKEYYRILIQANKDYKNNYFNKVPNFISK